MSIFSRNKKTIDELKYNFDSGARANRFYMEFHLPTGFNSKGDEKGGTRSMGLRVDSVSLPGRELEVKQFSEYGQVRNLPTGGIDVGGNTIDVVFNCDQNFADRLIIEAWQQTIFSAEIPPDKDDPQFKAEYAEYREKQIEEQNSEVCLNNPLPTPTSGNVLNPQMMYYDDYIGQVEIHQQRLDGKKALSYKLYEAYPVSFEAQELSMQTSDEILKFTVKIAFRNWDSKYHNHPMRSALNKGRVILDSLLDGANLLGRFGKGDKFRKTLSNLDTRATQVNNLFNDGGG